MFNGIVPQSVPHSPSGCRRTSANTFERQKPPKCWFLSKLYRAKEFGKVRGSTALVAPQGFEPRYAAPEAAVLPLNEGAMQAEHAVQRAFMDDKCSRACGQSYRLARLLPSV